MPKSSLYYAGLFSLLGILAGCDNKQDIKVYRVSKESAAPAAPMTDNSGMPPMQGTPSQPGMPAEAGPAAGGPGLRAWRIVDGAVHEVALSIDD